MSLRPVRRSFGTRRAMLTASEALLFVIGGGFGNVTEKLGFAAENGTVCSGLPGKSSFRIFVFCAVYFIYRMSIVYSYVHIVFKVFTIGKG